MKRWSRQIPFKVDIKGIIHIMGSALYSRPDSAIRELIQNSHDAIMRRRKADLNYQGSIHIRQLTDEGIIEIHDDGFGINAEDAEAYLGTLGIGLTGLLKGTHHASPVQQGGQQDLIGMFGIGLFSAFMLADRLVVESRRVDAAEAIRWVATGGTEIELSSIDREEVGTTVRLHLKPQNLAFAQQPELIEKVVKEYADFLPVPIYLNKDAARLNVIKACWMDPTPEPEALELELETYFNETPLDVIPVKVALPEIAGALYISPQRTPGFSGEAVVTATLRRMVISRDIHGLLPEWASFVRGVVELGSCAPTASREDLIKNQEFVRSREAIENLLFQHFERLAKEDATRLQSILTWHRYSFAGSALIEPRLRAILRSNYKFPTSKGALTFEEILAKSSANPLFETEVDRVIWYNTDRRQESWVNSIFVNHDAPCVHALRSFEESLLATMVAESGGSVDLRYASPTSAGFAQEILHMDDLEDADDQWANFLGDLDARILVASFDSTQPVMAFLNERHELKKNFDELKSRGVVPAGFQRMIDRHFEEAKSTQNEVLLNRDHRLVARALQQSTNSPLAGVLRLLVTNSLRTAGATLPNKALRAQGADLDWIADCLWGRDSGDK